MKTRRLWLNWLYMFVLCAVLGFVPKTDIFIVRALLIIAAVCFFIPGFLLLGKGSPSIVKKVMLISGISLTLTIGLIIFNFASVLMPDAWGTVAHILMGIFTTPMLCGQYWIISIFGWAALLAAGLFKLPQYR